MTIETKYNIGDEVWFMQNNKICSDTITAIHAYRTETISHITYGFGTSIHSQVIAIISERDLFPTKEKLLKSL